MRAVCWMGAEDVRVRSVPEPVLQDPRDAIVRVTLTAICGSDLHLYDGCIPTMTRGDILGHEFMGEVVEVGSEIDNLRPGDRVVVPFPIACGHCQFCATERWSLCDNSNPNAAIAEEAWGHAPAGLFGYSHMLGGYDGGQAEYVRVPFADVGPLKVDGELADEQVLFLSDILPTGWQAALNCDIESGHVVAVWGCGPVGLFAIESALLMGAHRVVAIDRVPERLALAREAGALTIDYSERNVFDELREFTGGRGPDGCIDAVGMEAHGFGLLGGYDRVKQATMGQTDRPTALREAIQACGKGGTVSIPGVYGGVVDKLNLGAAFGKGLTLRMGQTHVHRYLPELLDHVRAGRFDATSLISHRVGLEDAPECYRMFRDKQDGCTKVVMKP